MKLEIDAFGFLKFYNHSYVLLNFQSFIVYFCVSIFNFVVVYVGFFECVPYRNGNTSHNI